MYVFERKKNMGLNLNNKIWDKKKRNNVSKMVVCMYWREWDVDKIASNTKVKDSQLVCLLIDSFKICCYESLIFFIIHIQVLYNT